MRSLLRAFLATAALWLGACAGIPHGDPLRVSVAGIESVPGEGLELRVLLRLRVQNPNDAPVEYDGASVELAVQDVTFAAGVTDARGSVPRFGEAVIDIPVTVSVLKIVGHMVSSSGGPPTDRIRYSLRGKLSGTGFSTYRFKSEGEMQLPASQGPTAEPTASR